MNIQNTYTLHREEKAPSINPMLRKISKIKTKDAEVATYTGIFGKFAYFMLMIIAGVALALVFEGFGGIGVDAITREVYASTAALIGVLAAAVIFLLFPLVAFIFRKTIPVMGSMYCMSTGYLLGFILTFSGEFAGYMLMAMVLTFSLVFAMGYLFFNGHIHITNRFRAITTTLFTTMIISSIALLIAYFIPGLHGSVQQLLANPLIAISSALGGVVIASMFLLLDFDTVSKTVQDRLPKEYEWYAAFSVAFTVVWLYFKVLDLIIKIKDATT